MRCFASDSRRLAGRVRNAKHSYARALARTLSARVTRDPLAYTSLGRFNNTSRFPRFHHALYPFTVSFCGVPLQRRLGRSVMRASVLYFPCFSTFYSQSLRSLPRFSLPSSPLPRSRSTHFLFLFSRCLSSRRVSACCTYARVVNIR